MPIFFQQQINETTRLGIWKMEETEDFFKRNVPAHRDVTHPHKRLQHLAGRFLLQYLYPGFPYELIQIADTKRPFLPGDPYHFSISHCGDYAAAIVSTSSRVGVDIEIPVPKIQKIKNKFLSPAEVELLNKTIPLVAPDNPEPETYNLELLTLFWSCKEAVYKWYAAGGVDFSEHIRLLSVNESEKTVPCIFTKTGTTLLNHFRLFDRLVLVWVV